MTQDNKQNTSIAKLEEAIRYLTKSQEEGFKHLEEQQSRMIESYNGKFKMTDDRITRVCDKHNRLDTRLQDVEKVQAVRISNLTKVIAGFAIGATLLAQKVWEFIFNA
jgi:hypothetical protein